MYNFSLLITLAEFVKMLNEMRFGKLTALSIEKFKSLSRPLQFDDGIVPTELWVQAHLVHTRDAEITGIASHVVKM